jgi:RimJ/RimL family protein N-acetyltransferase
MVNRMEDLIIRELRSQDAQTLIDYTKRIGAETDNLTFGAEGFPVTVEDEQRMLEQMHNDNRSIMLGVFRKDQLIANGSLSALPRRMSHRSELGLSVIKEEWNKGLGNLLLEKLIEFARSSGTEIINLEVRSDNRSAIHLYEKFGFKHIGTSPAFFKIDNRYYDFELMYLDLR